MPISGLSLVRRYCGKMYSRHLVPYGGLRVSNRFYGIRDLAYFKAGIRDRDEIRDTGFGDLSRRELGNVALKKPRFGNSRD